MIGVEKKKKSSLKIIFNQSNASYKSMNEDGVVVFIIEMTFADVSSVYEQ